jgi:membrane protease YdiL (CAAX protease family)
LPSVYATVPTSAPTAPRPRVGEALTLWAVAFAGIVVVKALGEAIPLFAGQAKTAAAVLFLYLPAWRIRRHGELVDDYGVPPWPWTSPGAARQWGRDLRWFLGVAAVLVPATVGGFFAFLELIEHLPPDVRLFLTPYRGGAGDLAFRLPDRFWLLALDQLLVVALPEEFFYRAYLQTTLTRAWGEGRGRLFGAAVGPAFFATQALFALGHLAELHPWRLAVFFPSLLFGWLRLRTGSIVAPILVHALSNLLLMALEASAFGN